MDIPKEPCPKCNGKGIILNNDEQLIDFVCPRCGGEGKLDWIEMAMPKYHVTFKEMYSYLKELWAKEENMSFEFPIKMKGVLDESNF